MIWWGYLLQSQGKRLWRQSRCGHENDTSLTARGKRNRLKSDHVTRSMMYGTLLAASPSSSCSLSSWFVPHIIFHYQQAFQNIMYALCRNLMTTNLALGGMHWRRTVLQHRNQIATNDSKTGWNARGRCVYFCILSTWKLWKPRCHLGRRGRSPSPPKTRFNS